MSTGLPNGGKMSQESRPFKGYCGDESAVEGRFWKGWHFRAEVWSPRREDGNQELCEAEPEVVGLFSGRVGVRPGSCMSWVEVVTRGGQQ